MIVEFDKSTETFQRVNSPMSSGRGGPGLSVVNMSDISASLSGCDQEQNSTAWTPTQGNLIDTLRFWGPLFEISFDLWIESFQGGDEYGWSEFLRFTTTDNYCCDEGDRIPAFQANADGFIYIISQIGGGYNAYERFEVMPKTWKSFRVRQYLNNQQEVQFYSYKLFELNYVSRPFLKLS